MFPFLQKIVHVQKLERKRAFIMAGYIFLIMASYNVLKPMARSLFVTNLSPAELPILYIILAVAVGLVSVAYLRVSTNLRLDRLITFTALFFAANLILFWWLLSSGQQSPSLYYALFIWTSIYGILTSTQFWLLASYLFNAREAKRLFPLLTTCAILGGILGGYLTRVSVQLLGGTANLAFLGIGFLAATVGLVNLAWRSRDESIERAHRSRPREEARNTPRIVGEVIKLVQQSRHLALLVGIVCLTYMVVQIADFQFVAFASDQIEGTDELAGFLGLWLSNLGLLAFLFQVFVAGYILRKFGVGATILFLPAALLVSSVWVFASASLVSILAIKVGDGAFRHSINKVGTELLYLPISQEIKRKTKVFIDMFADRFARGMAGVLLLVFYSWLGFSVSQISLVAIVLVGIWLALSMRTYREYVESFRQALASRRIDADSLDFSIRDLSVINSLIISLGSTNQRQVIYALRMLESVEGVELLSPLRPLLHSSYSNEVRLLALKLLYEHGDVSLLPEIESLLRDKDEAIRFEAVRCYTKFSETPTEELLEAWLNDPDFGVSGAALQFLGQNPELAEILLSSELLELFMGQGSQGQELVADTVGRLQDERYYSFLSRLLKTHESADRPKESLRRVTNQAIESAGRTGSRDFVALLIEKLGHRATRSAAREALASYGDSIAPDLTRCLEDTELATEIRASIVRVFERIGTQKSVEILLDHLLQGEHALRHPTIKALSKLRTRFSDLQFDKRVDEAVLEELQEYFQIQATLYQTNGNVKDGSAGADLLTRALQERLDDHLERIFRLLGLRYPPRDIYNAYAATSSSNRSIRANAIEFLDNILSSNYKEQLLLVVDDLPIEQVLERANGLLKYRFGSCEEALHYLLKNGDPWLRACSLYEIGYRGLVKEFESEIRLAEKERDTLVHETAARVLEKFS
jgi:AAA family ATP:ADP antiporter